MRRANAPWRPVTPASLDWTDNGVPRSTDFGDVYYSRDNGLEESRHVFLQGNDLPGRWGRHADRHFCIGETGFGTGLNFLLTWQAWRALPGPRPALHYLAIEQFPLRRADLARALAQWPGLDGLAAALLEHYPGLVPGQHRLLLEPGRVTLDLWWADVNEALPELAGRGRPLVDAWYLDGFAPAGNEAMWRPGVLRAVGRLSRPGASFSTFTAAGEVRRQLAGAGFAVRKVAGYGRKRENLRGELSPAAAATTDATQADWDLPASPPAPPERAIVIGAGLAGCTAAAALARRGVAVTLLDAGALAGGGSGNEQGVLFTRLSPRHSPLVDFALQSFCFSAGFYRGLFADGILEGGRDGDLCGTFQQSREAGEMTQLAAVLGEVPELARVLQPSAASELLGIDQDAAGYWYPRSGWLHPAGVCRALARQPNIALREHCGALALEQLDSGWLVRDGAGTCWQAPCVVVAAGPGCKGLAGLQWLPLQAIRGQTTSLPAAPPLDALRAVLCHRGYIAPAAQGRQCLGATFKLDDDSAAVRASEHRENLEQLAGAVPAWSGALKALEPATLDGRVGFRCASPDYLPLAGPVPDREGFLRDYAQLRKNARQPINAPGQYLNGLYLTTGHGSRGLSSTALAAELLASAICDEPPPLSRELTRALSPARFIIRDLRRNKI